MRDVASWKATNLVDVLAFAYFEDHKKTGFDPWHGQQVDPQRLIMEQT